MNGFYDSYWQQSVKLNEQRRSILLNQSTKSTDMR